MEQKNQFYKLLDDQISKLNKNKKSKFVIDQETYDKVLSALLLPKGSKCPDGASFKFWSNQHFKTEQIGENQLVYCKKHPALLPQRITSLTLFSSATSELVTVVVQEHMMNSNQTIHGFHV